MGIPFYFKHITNTNKSILSFNKQKCDRLFLDFNGIIYNVYNTIKHVHSNDNMNIDEFEEILIENVLNYTNTISEFVMPTHLLYICLDGVAPLAKIQQQRKRRFISAWTSKKIPKNNQYIWDTNAISPGTKFMAKLNMALRSFVKKSRNTYETIFSGSDENGEGEHKIFDYIHFHPEASFIDVIYGLDADLIMLSLICNKSKKFLLRDNNSNEKSQFSWFNVDLLRTNLLQYYSHKINIHSYVFLCFCLGNDFLPNLTYINIKHSGLDYIINAYLMLYEKWDSNIIECEEYSKYTINYDMLIQLIDSLSTHEDKEFKKQHDMYFKKNIVYYKQELKLENYGILNKNYKYKGLFDSSWRQHYYMHLFDMNINQDEIINNVCLKYIQGLFWITNYYFNKKNCNNWFYPYMYSPTLLDLYNYISTYNYEHIQKKLPRPFNINSDIQLLMILPIDSYTLIDSTIHDLMFYPSPISYYYPRNIEIETYLKTKLHECNPILPQIDINQLQISYLNKIS